MKTHPASPRKQRYEELFKGEIVLHRAWCHLMHCEPYTVTNILARCDALHILTDALRRVYDERLRIDAEVTA